jgi:hypothetical protein
MGQGGAVDRDGGTFQWLTHEFKNFAENFGLLLEKQQVIVSKRRSMPSSMSPASKLV